MTTIAIPENLLRMEQEAARQIAELDRREALERARSDAETAANRDAFLEAARAQLPAGLADYLDADTGTTWTARTSCVEPYLCLPGHYELRCRFERFEGGWKQVPLCPTATDRLSRGECWYEVELPVAIDRPRHCGTIGVALWSARVAEDDCPNEQYLDDLGI